MKKALFNFLGYAITALPYRLQLKIGAILGVIAYFLMGKRRRIAMQNLAHCFPTQTESERKKLCFKNFQNLGMGMMEGLMSWFMSEARIHKIPYIWTGKENYEAAIATGKGIIALSSHMMCVEMIGRIFGKYIPAYLVHKQSRDPVIEAIISKGRLRSAKGLLKHSNMKAMISSLRQGKLMWFAPDQDFGRPRSVFASFCGQPAATIVATSLLAKMGNAVIVPMFFRRTKQGYELKCYPMWENFPTNNDYKDAKRYNDLLTEFVKENPEQYLWIHRRFKTTESGQNIYQK